MTDQQLLQQYVDSASEAAFGELVSRYTDLVFGVAIRGTADRQLAEETAQNVFLILSRKAKNLSRAPEKLPGWLHRTAVLEAKNFKRREIKRQRKMNDYQHLKHDELSGSPTADEVCGIIDDRVGVQLAHGSPVGVRLPGRHRDHLQPWR